MKSEVDLLVGLQEVLADRPGLVPGARALSHFGEHALGWMALAALGAAVDERRRRQWVGVGVSAFASHAASVVIKRVVRRQRPHDPRIRVGVGTPSRLSFPSSHATSTAAALTSLSSLSGSTIPLAGIPVMMVSRMVLGVHYPTDTLAGALLGVVTSRAVTTIERKIA
ncbi:undecaprenyl pyrophosphate phosphatase [Corynebacterium atrinae]|uniref:phosphatase PAP2 family protein n=1 Tax=Corynebacterium atrinae TaxID=1336740 RepID=UPI0025B4B653|nr:phosphatase PAP2 family protein [Corynebacterium atrinae]WJY64539.1 undecaprenyl pyrophosphate phosphatase [Corynebacterium atrinae]